jgi:putative membrane protein
MGAADVVPGVSGGTMALIVGIYERLVAPSAPSSPPSRRRSARRLRPGARRRFGEVEWRLVLPLALGIVTAIVIGSRVIPR